MTLLKKKPLVIYHGEDCSDGFASAWCFHHLDKNGYDFNKGEYQKRLPKVNDRDVFLVDFSYKRADVITLSKYAKSITILDHHRSAIKELKDLDKDPLLECEYNFVLDQTRSGAGITWDYLIKDERPVLIDYIEDRDLWKFSLPYCKDIMASVYSYNFSFIKYDSLMRITKGSAQFKRLVNEGKAIRRNINKEIKTIINSSLSDTEICGFEVPLVNCPRYLASDLGNRICKNKPFSLTYFYTDTHGVFSLRSDENGVDVSIIAEHFGGGGHKHAAGFKIKREEIETFWNNSNKEDSIDKVRNNLAIRENGGEVDAY